jgi:hypothetical protein
MADRPIIFSAPMVRALLDGRKTQTRRLVNPQPETFLVDGAECEVAALHVQGEAVPRIATGLCLTRQKLAYAAGDRLYVREAWCHTGDGVWSIADARRAMNGKPIYRATDEADAGTKWWPSIHMPREFSRLTLTVSDVRVQRLQAISEQDAQAEGVAKLIWDGEDGWYESDTGTYRCGFAGIWQHLHGADSWDENQFVVAVSFSVARGNVDRLPS